MQYHTVLGASLLIIRGAFDVNMEISATFEDLQRDSLLFNKI